MRAQTYPLHISQDTHGAAWAEGQRARNRARLALWLMLWIERTLRVSSADLLNGVTQEDKQDVAFGYRLLNMWRLIKRAVARVEA